MQPQRLRLMHPLRLPHLLLPLADLVAWAACSVVWLLAWASHGWPIRWDLVLNSVSS